MNSRKNWELEIDEAVLKALKKIPRRDGQRIIASIESLSVDPFDGDIQKMKGEEAVWRRRVGSFRIFYELDAAQHTVNVFHCERRTSKTY